MLHVILFTALGLTGAAEALEFTSADWPAPLRTEALLAHRPLAALVQRLDAQPAAVLVIRHAGGDAGSDFARALRDALVSVGLSSARMRLEPAAAADGQLILEVTDEKPKAGL
jgi:hypothetical protein